MYCNAITARPSNSVTDWVLVGNLDRRADRAWKDRKVGLQGTLVRMVSGEETNNTGCATAPTALTSGSDDFVDFIWID